MSQNTSIDNVLEIVNSFDKNIKVSGDILVFSGTITDRNRVVLPNLTMEIWQTDSYGVYDHPNDPKTNKRNKQFQFFGHHVTDRLGNYQFRTSLPGTYGGRPRHIHFKIKDKNKTILTSQIYFSEDGNTIGAGGSNENLKMELIKLPKSSNADYYGKFDIVINTPVTGILKPTDSQSTGPFYPVVQVTEFDNDLVN